MTLFANGPCSDASAAARNRVRLETRRRLNSYETLGLRSVSNNRDAEMGEMKTRSGVVALGM